MHKVHYNEPLWHQVEYHDLTQRSFADAQTLQDAVAVVLQNLGHTRLRQADRAGAAAGFREGLALSHAHDNRRVRAECLAGLAGVAAAEGRPARAARLLAAAEALLRAADARLDAVDQAEYDRHVAAARAQLAEPAFATAWAEGRAMPLEHAVAYALEEPTPA